MMPTVKDDEPKRDYRIRAVPACACGQPQRAAVRVHGGLIAKCERHYAEWWDSQRISSERWPSTSDLAEQIREASKGRSAT